MPTVHSMANSDAAGNPTEMQFLELPADSIATIGSFLDANSLNKLEGTCKRCYFILAPNIFSILPARAIRSILDNLDQNDVMRLWATCKLFYRRCIDQEKPFKIRCDNYFPYYAQKGSATHQMIKHIGKLVSYVSKRKIPVSLNLAEQSQRPGIDQKLFIPRLFAMLTWDNTALSVVELDLSRNFIQHFPTSLVHTKLVQSGTHGNTAAMNAINIACSFSPNLTKLILNGNDLVAIPDQIARLRELRILSLTWNYLECKSLEPCRHLTSLTELDLTRNRLTTIPNFFQLLDNLRLLNVSENPLDEETKRQLKEKQNKQTAIVFDKE